MGLVNMHRVQFVGGIDDSPMLIGPDLDPHHGGSFGGEFFSVDIEALFIFRECRDESGRNVLLGSQVDRFVRGRLPSCDDPHTWGKRRTWQRIGQYHTGIGITLRTCVDAPRA
jgi:hypothetical protein